MYTLCTTHSSVSQALQVLSKAEYIFLDCEGRDLGSATGALSLISLGTPDASHIYLFDVLLLPHEALQILFNSIFSLTSDARGITKVVWDGRMDYVELFYSYTCPIENVLDLQLVDVLSRSRRRRNGNEKDRLKRFIRKDFPVSEVDKLQLEEAHMLNGMDGAIQEHKIWSVDVKDQCIKKLHANNLSKIWMHRPLSRELLSYAASDIKRIASIYDHFLQRGYLERLEDLRDVSAAYVSIHKNEGRPDPKNIFLKGPYLPLSIPLEVTARKADGLLRPESKKNCAGCKRAMAERHFPLESAANLEDKGKGKENGSASEMKERRSAWCKICTLIIVKAKLAEERKARQKAILMEEGVAEADGRTQMSN